MTKLASWLSPSYPKAVKLFKCFYPGNKTKSVAVEGGAGAGGGGGGEAQFGHSVVNDHGLKNLPCQTGYLGFDFPKVSSSVSSLA